MLGYMNRGIILEQAICSLVKEYFKTLNLNNKYPNFHISVTTQHPFAELIMHENLNAQDSFPCVVITTHDDKKPSDFTDLAPHVEAIGITSKDLESITKTTETYIDKNGKEKQREIAGLCTIIDENTLQTVKDTIEKQGMCYGLSIRTRRNDTISVEVWAENEQLKNEIYEQLRLFITGNLRFLLTDKYPFFAIAIFDNTVVGQRSNNYNMDFDVALSGSHISFDVDYCIEQIVFNTELTGICEENKIITEVLNHV